MCQQSLPHALHRLPPLSLSEAKKEWSGCGERLNPGSPAFCNCEASGSICRRTSTHQLSDYNCGSEATKARKRVVKTSISKLTRREKKKQPCKFRQLLSTGTTKSWDFKIFFLLFGISSEKPLNSKHSEVTHSAVQDNGQGENLIEAEARLINWQSENKHEKREEKKEGVEQKC